MDNSEEDKKWNKNLDKALNTQGRKKLWNYFIEITKTESFQNTIKHLREKYNIPPQGFSHSEYGTLPPEKWELRFSPKSRELDKELKDICEKHNLHFLYWSEILQNIVFYDEVSSFSQLEAGPDLCFFTDLKIEYEEPFSKEIQEADNSAYPIAIRISPYATERDILDFVKGMYPLMSRFLENYKEKGSKIGKVKKKKTGVSERNDFIWENRNLPRRQIMELLTETYGVDRTIDFGYIGKIISLEKKKRKEM
jgi:hypothetical protein